MPCPFLLVGRLQPDPGTRVHRRGCPLLLTAQPRPAPSLSPLLTGHPLSLSASSSLSGFCLGPCGSDDKGAVQEQCCPHGQSPAVALPAAEAPRTQLSAEYDKKRRHSYHLPVTVPSERQAPAAALCPCSPFLDGPRVRSFLPSSEWSPLRSGWQQPSRPLWLPQSLWLVPVLER